MYKFLFQSLFIASIFFSFVGTSSGQVVRMNATNDGSTFNITCPSTGVRFADEGSGSSHYSDNSDYTITFCADAGKILKFDFGCGSNLTIERIDPTDTLYIYDGASTSDPLIYAMTGTNSNGDRIPYLDESSDAVFVSPSSCITFRFVSDGATNNDGWDACIRCVDPVDCGGNDPASDMFGGAPTICNLDGYCGTTSGDYGGDFPFNLNPSGGNCPSGQNFLGTIENNSWLKFEASSTTAVFDFEVALGGGCANGIQAAILSFDGSSLTRMSDCALSDGSHAGNFQVTGAGLTVGETYYLMVDGNAGDVCDYSISANNGVTTVDAGQDQVVCPGDPVNLSATGVSGDTYVWSSLDNLITNDPGQNQTYNPLVETIYVVEAVGDCNNSSDTVNVLMCNLLPSVWGDFKAEVINESEVILNWITLSEQNSDRIEVYRLNTAGQWENIGFVTAAGESLDLIEYNFIDRSPSGGVNYYKLSFVDFDGSRANSEIRSADISSLFNVQFVPNPVGDISELNFGSISELNNAYVNLKIYSQIGQDVTHRVLISRSSEKTLSFDLRELGTGHYWISVEGNIVRFFKK